MTQLHNLIIYQDDQQQQMITYIKKIGFFYLSRQTKYDRNEY